MSELHSLTSDYLSSVDSFDVQHAGKLLLLWWRGDTKCKDKRLITGSGHLYFPDWTTVNHMNSASEVETPVAAVVMMTFVVTVFRVQRMGVSWSDHHWALHVRPLRDFGWCRLEMGETRETRLSLGVLVVRVLNDLVVSWR